MDRLFDALERMRDVTFGWRKLGLLIAVLAALFVWLFVYTVRVGDGVVVPDLPPAWAGLVGFLYLTFAGANWLGKRERANGSGEPS